MDAVWLNLDQLDLTDFIFQTVLLSTDVRVSTS